MPRRTTALALINATILLLAGCGSSNNSSSEKCPPKCEIPTITTAPDCTTANTVEGCDEAHMKDYYNVTINFVTSWINDRYARQPTPTRYVFIAEGESSNGGCGPQDENSYAYCPIDKNVYVGQKEEWVLYTKFGAIGPAVGLAHEYGHHIQNVTGVPDPPHQNTPEDVNHEDQADCIAGAWVEWADEKKMIQYPQDLQNVQGLMAFISDAEGPNQGHGDPSQRTRSFDLGFGGGLGACNSYYSNTPILTNP